jgi:hypothetical protein
VEIEEISLDIEEFDERYALSGVVPDAVDSTTTTTTTCA